MLSTLGGETSTPVSMATRSSSASVHITPRATHRSRGLFVPHSTRRPRSFHESVDLLHIDGRHQYADVRHDFETWRPKLSDRAVVLFHDTTVGERNFGVFQLWKEVADSHPHFEFLHGNGLGVLGFGREQTPSLQALFEARSNSVMTDTVRRIYAHRGRSITNHCELLLAGARFSKELADRDSEVARLRNLVAMTAVKSMSR